MKEQLISIIASDGVILHGAYWRPDLKTDRIIIHVHGMAGNFYENDFIFDMAKAYTDSGYAFLSCNNRGHDYIADIARFKGNGFKGGAAYEVFEDCICDIDGYINFANQNGYSDITLQGHSSGANKVAYWCANNTNLNSLKRVIFLSPCDDIGLNIDELGNKKYSELLSKADVLISSFNGDAIMPDGTFYDYPISAKTYKNIFSQDSAFDIFHYRSMDTGFTVLSKILCPKIVFFGNVNEFLLQNSSYIKENVFEKLIDCTFFEIEGANHSYVGKSNILIKRIIEWLSKYE